MSATQNVIKFGKGNGKVWDVTLTVGTAATTATCTSTDYFAGRVVKVELDPGTLAGNFTIKGYEANTPLATGTRDHFLDYTVATAVELVMYPVKDATVKNTGAAVTTARSTEFIVCDRLRLDLAAAVAADVLRVRVYIEE
jgi:hypothetical protein